MGAVEGDEGYLLVGIGEFLLHLAHGVESFVHTCESLLADGAHTAALVNNNQIEYILFHFVTVLNGY